MQAAGGTFGCTRGRNSDVNSISRKIRLRLALSMAVALLIAQFGAQAHAYAHLGDAHLGGPLGSGDQLELRLKPCGDCQSFAPLLAAASAPILELNPSCLGVAPKPAVTLLMLAARANFHAFRSRAPPAGG